MPAFKAINHSCLSHQKIKEKFLLSPEVYIFAKNVSIHLNPTPYSYISVTAQPYSAVQSSPHCSAAVNPARFQGWPAPTLLCSALLCSVSRQYYFRHLHPAVTCRRPLCFSAVKPPKPALDRVTPFYISLYNIPRAEVRSLYSCPSW